MNRVVQLIDTTLRDGAQAPNISFSRTEKIQIVKMLSNAGIRLFEAGIPAMGDRECQDISELISFFPHCRFISWCRANAFDIHNAKKCGCEAVHLSFPASPLHMSIMGITEKQVLCKVEELTNLARKYFSYVSIGAQDASRASPQFLVKFINSAIANEVSHVRIADTVGILSPITAFNLIGMLKKECPECYIEFHGHNDFGMATANTIAALEAGAELASVTVNGIGERAGNAAFEEVAMAIHHTTKLNLSIDAGKINQICKDVAMITNMSIPESKPITGNAIFTHESGVHCHAQLKSSSAYEPYNPQLTGHSASKFMAGTHSGRAGISAILENRGITLTPQKLDSFVIFLKTHSLELKRSMSDDETVQLYRRHFG